MGSAEDAIALRLSNVLLSSKRAEVFFEEAKRRCLSDKEKEHLFNRLVLEPALLYLEYKHITSLFAMPCQKLTSHHRP